MSTAQLSERFTEVILSGTWIANTNFHDQLAALHWETAVAKVGSHNTIAELAQHVHYYIAGIKKVLKGGSLDIRDQYSFDFAPIQSQQQWDNFLNKFWADAKEFANLIRLMPEQQLNESFVDQKYGTYLRNIDGMIEHSYYHLGQIVLIRKLLS